MKKAARGKRNREIRRRPTRRIARIRRPPRKRFLERRPPVQFHEIEIRNGEVVTEFHCFAGSLDWVCWINHDTVDRVVHFDNGKCPLLGKVYSILVRALSPSPWFKIDPNATKDLSYLYHIDDLVPPPIGPDVIPQL